MDLYLTSGTMQAVEEIQTYLPMIRMMRISILLIDSQTAWQTASEIPYSPGLREIMILTIPICFPRLSGRMVHGLEK